MPLWLSISLAVVPFIVSITALVSTMKNNSERTQQAVDRVVSREENAAKEFTSFVVDVQKFIAAQSEINKTVAGVLSSISEEIRSCSRLVSEQPLVNRQVADALSAVTSRLESVAKASIESNTVSSLVAEFVKASQVRMKETA